MQKIIAVSPSLFKIQRDCTYLNNSLTYTAYNSTNFAPLSSSTFVSVNASTGFITVSASAPVGKYQIKIIGLISSTSQKQDVTVTLTGIKKKAP